MRGAKSAGILKRRTVFHKFIFTYIALVFGVTLFLGGTASILSIGTYNSEIERNKATLLDQYKSFIEVEAWRKAYDITAHLLSGSGMTVGINQFLYSPIVDLPTVNYIKQDLVQFVLETSDIISAVYIYDKDRDIILSSDLGLKYLSTYKTIREEKYRWLPAVAAQEQTSLWMVSDIHGGNTVQRTIMLIRTYPAGASVESSRGYVAVGINESYVQTFFSEISAGNEDILMMVDEKGGIVSRSGQDGARGDGNGSWLEELDGMDSGFLKAPHSGGFSIRIGGMRNYLTYSAPFSNGWRLIFTTQVDSFYAASDGMLKTLAVICTVSILLGIVVAYFFAYKMYMPIRTLTNKLKSAFIPRASDAQSLQNEYAFIDNSVVQLNDRISSLSQKLDQNLPLLKFNLVISLINRTIPNQAVLQQRMELLGHTPDWKYFNVMLFVLNEKLTDRLELKNTQLVKYGICDQVESMNSLDRLFIASEISDNEVAVLIFTNNRDVLDTILYMEDYLKEQHYGEGVSIALGSYTDHALLLCDSFRDTRNAVQYRFFLPDQIVFLYDEIVGMGHQSPQKLEKLVKEFDRAVRSGDIAASLSLVKSFEEAAETGRYTYEDVNAKLLELISVFSNYARNLDLEVKYMVDDFEGKFAGIGSIREFTVWFCEIVQKILTYRDRKMSGKAEETIELVKKYIAENLSGDLSLRCLAEMAGISMSYLSRIFKENSDLSLVDYITAQRMEKARELIENTDINIETVAVKVGYPTHHYFSKRFKEYYGYTPKYFRFMKQNDKSVKSL